MSWTSIRQALVMGIVAGILATIAYVLKVGDVFAIDVHALVNVFALAGFTAISAFLTNLGTTKKGNFLGAVNVKDVY